MVSIWWYLMFPLVSGVAAAQGDIGPVLCAGAVDRRGVGGALAGVAQLGGELAVPPGDVAAVRLARTGGREGTAVPPRARGRGPQQGHEVAPFAQLDL